MTATDQERYLAARAAHVAGDYYPPADVKAAQDALHDLIERTRGRNTTRDEKRLLRRYSAVIDAHADAQVTKYRDVITKDLRLLHTTTKEQ